MRDAGQHLPALLVLWPLAVALGLLWRQPAQEELARGSDHVAAGWLWQRRLSFVSGAVTLLLALALVAVVADGTVLVYALGNWPAPFGIVLVADRLGAGFVLLTALVALAGLWFALGTWDHRGRAFHSFWHLLWAGVNGAFLTGDIFNLFVFFEVLLIASYALLVHGGATSRLRAGFGYTVVNLFASALFLLGLALTYGAFGHLNLALMTAQAATLSASQQGLASAAAALLFVVFALKAAAFPLHLWLPVSYAAATPAVAAFFAILTKVGVYALMRVHGGALAEVPGVETLRQILMVSGLAAALIGAFAALGARRLRTVVANLTVSSVGVMLVAVGLGSVDAAAAGLFYLAQSTLSIALLFVLVALIAAQRGRDEDWVRPGQGLQQPVALGLLLLLAAASVIGVPPLPGFLGKLLVLQASSVHAAMSAVWAVLLISSAVVLVALVRAGILVLWHTLPRAATADLPAGSHFALMRPALALAVLVVVMTLAAQPVYRFVREAAAQNAEPFAYVAIRAQAEAESPWLRPLPGAPMP